MAVLLRPVCVCQATLALHNATLGSQFPILVSQFTGLLQEHAGFIWAGQSPATSGLLDCFFNICMVMCLAVTEQAAQVISKDYLKTADQSNEAVQVCQVKMRVLI